ncbi:MAG: hypothetical protein WKF50_14815, partial [Nocardioides sp.]
PGQRRATPAGRPGEPPRRRSARAGGRVDPEVVVLDPEKSVTVTREEDHQDVLGRYGRDAPTLVAVSLALCAVARGKHVGSSTIEVRVDGERVGDQGDG